MLSFMAFVMVYVTSDSLRDAIDIRHCSRLYAGYKSVLLFLKLNLEASFNITPGWFAYIIPWDLCLYNIFMKTYCLLQ